MRRLTILIAAFLAFAGVCNAEMIMVQGHPRPRLTWQALTYNPTTYALELQSLGVGTPTLTRTTTQYCLDGVTGYYVAATANNPCWHGARYSGPTTGSPVAYADDGAGNLLATVPRLQVDQALTQSILQNRDFNVTWTKSATPPVLTTAAGIDGDSTHYISVSDNEVGAITNVSQVVYCTAGQNRVAKIRIKKDTDETRFPDFDIGGYALRVNTKTGAIADRTVSLKVASAIQEEQAGWWTLYMEASTDVTATKLAYITPAVTNAWATPTNAAAVGTVLIGSYEMYLNKTIAQVRGAGPIFTTTAAVTTGAQTGPLFDSSNISAASGLIVFNASTEGANNLLDAFATHDGTNFIFTDGTTADSTAASVSAIHKYAIWWHGAWKGKCIDGTCTADSAYDGGLLTGSLDAFRTAAYMGKINSIRGYNKGGILSYPILGRQLTQ